MDCSICKILWISSIPMYKIAFEKSFILVLYNPKKITYNQYQNSWAIHWRFLNFPKKSSQGGVRFHNLRLYSTKPGTTQSLNYQNHQICQAPRHKNFWKTGFFWYCTTDVSIGHKSLGSIWKFVRNMKFTNFGGRKNFHI